MKTCEIQWRCGVSSPGTPSLKNRSARQKGPMDLFIRTIGIVRARTKIGLANLTYNMQRMVWLMDQATAA